jgi:DNA repair exonuclease SbcCD ATPase subunit
MSSNSDSDIQELNKRKLALEVAELARPAWQRPAFITPIIAAVLSLALGYFSGWFNVQSTKLENQRHKLTQDIEKFENEKSTIEVEVKKLRAELESTKSSYASAVSDLDGVTAELATANEGRSNIQTKYSNLLGNLQRENKEKADNIASLRTELLAVRSRNDRTAIAQLEAKLKTMENSLRSTRIEELQTRRQELTEREQLLESLRRTGTVLDGDGCFVVKSGPAKGEQHCTNL